MNLVKYLTPINLREEKEKFFNSNSYNPQLVYDWNSEESVEWKAKNKKYQNLFDALDNQDGSKIKDIACAHFDTGLKEDFLNIAKNVVSTKPTKIQGQNVDSVTKAFSEAFQFLELSEYKLEVVDRHGFNFRPVAKERKIEVSKHLNLDFFSVDGEVKHELTHIIRYENGKFNRIKKAANYLPNEEGLATYCQDYAGENGKASLFQHAAEYTMTEVSLNGSFRDLFKYLTKIGFSEELAWQRGIRHKFGFKDTSNPGDIMKPSMYFYHQQLVKELREDEKYRLFVGKISIDQLIDFPEYRGKIPLSKLKEFYVWKEAV